jgi:hypothetical protein
MKRRRSGLSKRRQSCSQAQGTADHRPCGSGGLTVAYVCRLLPLTCLAPSIVEAILDGRQAKGLRLAEMLGNGPLGWDEQRESWRL